MQIVSLNQDAPYEFAQDVTPDVMVGLDGKVGEYSVPTIAVGSLPKGISYVAPGPESIFGTFKGTAKRFRSGGTAARSCFLRSDSPKPDFFRFFSMVAE